MQYTLFRSDSKYCIADRTTNGCNFLFAGEIFKRKPATSKNMPSQSHRLKSSKHQFTRRFHLHFLEKRKHTFAPFSFPDKRQFPQSYNTVWAEWKSNWRRRRLLPEPTLYSSSDSVHESSRLSPRRCCVMAWKSIFFQSEIKPSEYG